LKERVASVKHEDGMRYAAALLAFCVLALASGARAATEPFTIYAIDAVTGSGAFQGKTMAQAERMYTAIANKAGGINGQPIEMQIVDDQSNPRIAVQLANEIMTHHPAVILGPTIQATCNAVGALATAGPVIYCQSPGLNPPKDSFVFSSGVAITRTIPIAVRFARLSGARRLAFLIANDATGVRTEQLLDIVLGQPENRNVQVVARERFDDAALGIEAQLARIKAANADYLYVSAAGTPFQTVIRGLRDASDFDYEMQMAGMNAAMAPDIRTIFIPASPRVRHITATLVRQIAALGGDVSPFVPPEVASRFKGKS